MTEKSLITRTGLKVQDDKDLFKAVAMDIGKDVATYIEIMYPEAVKACSSTFLLSLRNHIYNSIVSVLEVNPLNPNETVQERLERHRKWRREWKAQWKKIREMEDERVREVSCKRIGS